MITEKAKRTQKFLIELNQFIAENSYYDDETETDVTNVNEADCYSHLMKTDEFHLLGEENVREYIKIALNDFAAFVNLLHQYGTAV